MDLKISYSSKGIENEDVEGLIVFLPEKSDTRAAGLSRQSCSTGVRFFRKKNNQPFNVFILNAFTAVAYF